MSDDEDFRDDDPPDHERTLRVLLVTDGESRLIRSSAVCERCGHLSVFHVYSPDCDCDAIATIGAPGLVIVRVTTEAEARAALARVREEWEQSFVGQGLRYHSVHGPGGHVLAVR